MSYGPGLTLISKTTLGGTTAAIDLTGIPGTFEHLRLYVTGRSNAAAQTWDHMHIELNGDTTVANYGSQRIASSASVVTEGQFTTGGYWKLPQQIPAANAGASAVGSCVIDFIEYANTTWSKVAGSKGLRLDTQAAFAGEDNTFVWLSTAVINRIKLTLELGSWLTGTVVSLYGVSAA